MSFQIPTPSEIIIAFFTYILGLKGKPFGLAILKNSVTAIQLKGKNNKGYIFGYKQLIIQEKEKKTSKPDTIKQICQKIQLLLKKCKPYPIKNNKCVLSIPDSKCYYKLLINKQAENTTELQNIFPVELDSLKYHTQKITIQKKPALHVTAIEKKELEKYLLPLQLQAGLKPIIAEPALTSILRNIEMPTQLPEASIILYQENNTLEVVALVKNLPVDSFSVPFPKTEGAALSISQNELQKTLQFLQKEYSITITDILIVGNKDIFKPLLKILQAEYKLPIHFLESFRVTPQKQLQKGITEWCMASGAALRGLGIHNENTVNLLK